MKLFKTGLIFALTLFVALFFTNAGAEPAKKDWQWPKMLFAVAGGLTSPGYVLAIAWTPMHTQDVGVKWRIIGEPSTTTRTYQLRDGKFNFLYSNLETGGELIMGGEGLATRDGGPFHLRLALPGFLQPFNLMAFGNAGLKTLEDIRNKPGTKYGVPIGTTAMVDLYHAFRAFLGMSEKELVMVPFGSFAGVFRGFIQGKCDVVGTGPTDMFAVRFSGGTRKGGIVFYDWAESDVEGNKRFRKASPLIFLGNVDWGVPEGLGKRMVMYPWIALTTNKEDPELVYRLLKWQDENYERFKTKCANCKYVTLNGFRGTLDMTYVPVHEGVIRYMKEKGLWTAADDIRQEYNIKVVDLHMKAYKEAITKAEGKKIKIIADNEDWKKLWDDYKKEKGMPIVAVLNDKEVAAGLSKLK